MTLHNCISAWESEEEAMGALDFENFSKKASFLDFEWEKTNITTFVSQNFGKFP